MAAPISNQPGSTPQVTGKSVSSDPTDEELRKGVLEIEQIAQASFKTLNIVDGVPKLTQWDWALGISIKDDTQ